jgi:hypothetical protein
MWPPNVRTEFAARQLCGAKIQVWVQLLEMIQNSQDDPDQWRSKFWRRLAEASPSVLIFGREVASATAIWDIPHF